MNAVPPKIKSSGHPRALTCIAVVLAVAAAAFVSFPAGARFFPACQFHRLTGLNCPGCGMTRAVQSLMHGDFISALHDNAFLVAALLLGLARGGWLVWRKIRRRPAVKFFPAAYLWPVLGVWLAFGILRNLPAGAFLSP